MRGLRLRCHTEKEGMAGVVGDEVADLVPGAPTGRSLIPEVDQDPEADPTGRNVFLRVVTEATRKVRHDRVREIDTKDLKNESLRITLRDSQETIRM